MTDSKSNFERRLLALREKFTANLYKRMNEIETAALSLKTATAEDEIQAALTMLRDLTHKLAGSSGTHGYANLGHTARNVELICQSLLEGEENPTSGDFDQIHQSIPLLDGASKAGAEIPLKVPDHWMAKAPLHQTALTDEEQHHIILVEDDTQQAELLAQLLINFGFTVRVLDHPSDLRQAIDDISPAAVIMDIVFPGDVDAGVTAVKAMRDEGILTCPVVFTSVREDFDARLKAVRGGSDGYVLKPVNIIELVDTLNRLIEKDEIDPYRILIVEDDPESAEYCKALLEGAGLSATTVIDPLLAAEALVATNPDVIVLDVEMPGCNGFELAFAIRQMGDDFLQIPIMFLTAHTERENKFRAAKTGSEDFLSKPIDPDLLITSVIARAERSRILKTLFLRLKAEEQRFSSITRSANEAIVSTDEKRLILSWNPGAEATFGYKAREVLGRPITILIPERHREAHTKGLIDLSNDKKAKYSGRTMEANGLHKSGAEMPLEISLFAWEARGQKQFAAIIRDITERKETEAALKASRIDMKRNSELLQTTLESIDQGFAVWDGEERLVAWNKNCLDYWYNPEDVHVGTSRLDILRHLAAKGVFGPGDSIRLADQRYHQIRDAGTDSEEEFTLLDGRVLYLKRYPMPDGGHASVYTDVTEQKKSEEDLRKLSHIADQSPVSIIVTDRDGTILYVNRAFSEVSGYAMAEVIGNKPEIVKSGMHPDKFYKALWSTITSGNVWSGEMQNRRKNGEIYWESVTISPLRSDGGEITSFIGAKEDITERKKLEDSLRLAKEQADKAN